MNELFFLIPLSLVMGFVTSVSGGGGVIGVPTMIALGIPPLNALALNRLSDVGYLIGSLKNYAKIGEFNFRAAVLTSIPLTIGAIAGAMFSVSVKPAFLQWFIVFAVFIGIVFLLYPLKPKSENSKSLHVFGYPVLLIVGFWSGAVAMAGSTFAVLALVLFFNRSYLGAKAIDVAASVPEILISALILVFYSSINWAAGAGMILASIIGAYIGSQIAIKNGDRFIRLGMVGISIVMIAKVVFVDILG
jgi:uncharacterized membrane protein YfcA